MPAAQGACYYRIPCGRVHVNVVNDYHDGTLPTSSDKLSLLAPQNVKHIYRPLREAEPWIEVFCHWLAVWAASPARKYHQVRQSLLR